MPVQVRPVPRILPAIFPFPTARVHCGSLKQLLGDHRVMTVRPHHPSRRTFGHGRSRNEGEHRPVGTTAFGNVQPKVYRSP